MGMFDDITCEADLPEGHPEGKRDFQTKSLGSCLNHYTITKDGRLMLHRYHVEDLEDDPDAPEVPEEKPLRRFLFRRTKRTRLEDLDTEFHGDFDFYDSIEGTRYEYVARFTHGQLEWIRKLEECSEIQRTMLDRGSWW
jgi:hypothetical protein